MGNLEWLDWLNISLYFVLVFGVAIWAMVRERTRNTSQDYFLAGRDSGWFIIGGSLFASNIGSEHLVGLAGTGATSGVAVAQFEILASLILLLLGWLFVPFYLRSGVVTMPEFLERRYSPAARWYLAAISRGSSLSLSSRTWMDGSSRSPISTSCTSRPSSSCCAVLFWSGSAC